MSTYNGDFLLTHDFAWITEEEFHRNKVITNSTITTSSYYPVVWDDGLLEAYNNTFGMSSSINGGFNISNQSSERGPLFSNIVSLSEYQEHDTFFSTTFNVSNFSSVPERSITLQSMSHAEMLTQGLGNDVHRHFDSPSPYAFIQHGGDFLADSLNVISEDFYCINTPTNLSTSTTVVSTQSLVTSGSGLSSSIASGKDSDQSDTADVVTEKNVHQSEMCSKVLPSSLSDHSLIHTGEKLFAFGCRLSWK